MKRVHVFLFLILMLGCSQLGQRNNPIDKIVNTYKECDKYALLGDIDLCLPAIDGMTECYSTPVVKVRVDKFNSEGNVILACYLNNDAYDQIDKINELVLQDYFLIYASSNSKGINAGQSQMNEIANVIDKSFRREYWSDFKKQYEINHDHLPVGRPILIESYSPNKNIRTFVVLSKLLVDNFEHISIMTLNTALIKNRIFIAVYFNNYDGEKSIANAKSKNDYMVLLLQQENK